jgi:hypothetical protein
MVPFYQFTKSEETDLVIVVLLLADIQDIPVSAFQNIYKKLMMKSTAEQFSKLNIALSP